MLITVIPTPFFGANCIVLQPDAEANVVVVDPSAGVCDQIRGALDRADAQVGAVLCTHGHPDHVWDAHEVASWAPDAPAPVWIPGPDRYRMDDPMSYLPMKPSGMDLTWHKPEDLRDVPSDTFEIQPGIWLQMLPAPGHTEGSALFLGECDVNIADHEGTILWQHDDPVPWALSADVIFAGSVGRTDLPGGDERQMKHTLRTMANAIDPRTVMIPGHGPLTTWAHELQTNQYVARARREG